MNKNEKITKHKEFKRKKIVEKATLIPDLKWYKNINSSISLILGVTAIIGGIFALYTKYEDQQYGDNSTLFLIDASKSIELFNNGKSNLEIIKNAINEEQAFISEKENTGLRFFGDGCEKNTWLANEIQPKNTSAIVKSLNSIQGNGKRPLLKGIVEGTSDFNSPRIKNSKIKRIVIITTGGDECQSSSLTDEKMSQIVFDKFKNLGIHADFFIIAYQASNDDKNKLIKTTKLINGQYLTAKNEMELIEHLNFIRKSVIDNKVDLKKGSNPTKLISIDKGGANEIIKIPSKPIAVVEQFKLKDYDIAELFDISGVSGDIHRMQEIGFIEAIKSIAFTNFFDAFITRHVRYFNDDKTKVNLNEFIILGTFPSNEEELLQLICEFYKNKNMYIEKSAAKEIIPYVSKSMTPLIFTDNNDKSKKMDSERYLKLLAERSALINIFRCTDESNLSKNESYRYCNENLLRLLNNNAFGDDSLLFKVLLSEWISLYQKNYNRKVMEFINSFKNDIRYRNEGRLSIYKDYGLKGNPIAAFNAAKKLENDDPAMSNYFYDIASRSYLKDVIFKRRKKN